jgi:hypothetical protein
VVENKDNFLNLKLDDLQKHARKKKVLVFWSKVLMHDYYISNDSQHQRNEMVHACQHPNFIVKLVFNGRKIKKKKIVTNFSSIETWQTHK